MTVWTDKHHCRSSQQVRQRLSSVMPGSPSATCKLVSHKIRLMELGR
jgi:hypothetical protein